jgi:hypothetical protein
MQIQPSWAANAAAGTVSQATSKDRAPGGAVEAAHVMASNQVERVARTESSSADRDAHGGGQGLGAHGQPASEHQAATTGTQAADGMSVVAPEPPSQLDIIG